jgi:hypothetical protein
MKPVLFTLFLSFLLKAGSQTWCPAGAVWHYGVSAAEIEGVLTYRYVADTVLDNTACKKISGTFSGTISPRYGNTHTVIPGYRDYYSYEDNEVVYLYNGTSFDTVVDYHARPGDQWLRLRSEVHQFECNSRLALTVTDTGHVFINGQKLKTISTSYTGSISFGSNTHTLTHLNTFIERVQNFPGGLYGNDLFPIYCEEKNILYEYLYFSFRCYQDDAFPLYKIGVNDCNNLTGLSSLDKNNIEIRLYPNPAEETITIETPGHAGGNFNYTIRDVLGRLVKDPASESSGHALKIDVSTFSAGIYFFEISGPGNTKSMKKFMKQ